MPDWVADHGGDVYPQAFGGDGDGGLVFISIFSAENGSDTRHAVLQGLCAEWCDGFENPLHDMEPKHCFEGSGGHPFGEGVEGGDGAGLEDVECAPIPAFPRGGKGMGRDWRMYKLPSPLASSRSIPEGVLPEAGEGDKYAHSISWGKSYSSAICCPILARSKIISSERACFLALSLLTVFVPPSDLPRMMVAFAPRVFAVM